jgi:hypothetical protein
MIRQTVPAVALVLSIAGCGDDGAGSPADAVRSYNSAVADGDGKAACDRLDKTAQDELRQSTQGPTRSSCAKVIETLAAFYDDATKERLRKAEVRAQPSGNRATATFNAPAALGGPDREQSYELRKVDGDWKIASLGLTPDPGIVAP